MNIPAGIETKKIEQASAEAGSVVTFAIVREFAAANGISTPEAGIAFARAHMALKIKLRSDKATGLGWVTADEASRLREHMAANV